MRLIGFAVMLIISVALAVVDTSAQTARTPRIGFLGAGTGMPVSTQVEAFRQGLRELGWIENQTVTIEYRWVEGNPHRIPELAADLVRLKVDILVITGSEAIRAVKEATSSIPVVFVVLVDPVAAGFVKSFARPGGNLTGLASQFEELSTKQLQLLKETLPRLSRIALLHRVESPTTFVKAAETAARDLGLSARSFKVAEAAEYENAFRAAQRERVGAIQVLPSPYFDVHHGQLIELAAKYRLPAIYEFKNYVQDGGLMSYGPDINRMFWSAASYVDRILKGAKPGDLPIERPSTFDLVINLKTAKALGLTIPQSILGRADQVIE
jgi:ABC-type uncharacterized transport system substrate-binding protein